MGRLRQEIWDLKKKSFKKMSHSALFFHFPYEKLKPNTGSEIIHVFAGFFDEMSVRFIKAEKHQFFFFH